MTRLIKIGFTRSFLEQRINALRCGSPDKILFLGAHPGEECEERMLHNKFHCYRLHGEWFEENTPLKKYIETNSFKSMEIAFNVSVLENKGLITRDAALKIGYKETQDIYNLSTANEMW